MAKLATPNKDFWLGFLANAIATHVYAKKGNKKHLQRSLTDFLNSPAADQELKDQILMNLRVRPR